MPSIVPDPRRRVIPTLTNLGKLWSKFCKRRTPRSFLVCRPCSLYLLRTSSRCGCSLVLRRPSRGTRTITRGRMINCKASDMIWALRRSYWWCIPKTLKISRINIAKSLRRVRIYQNNWKSEMISFKTCKPRFTSTLMKTYQADFAPNSI
jgi:hypothetical protein